jgi:hypothetical protein
VLLLTPLIVLFEEFFIYKFQGTIIRPSGDFMSRIININNPSKVRNQNQRTIAEILRRIGAKPTIDDETKDMAATIVFLLREIFAGVETSVQAWEKKGYWMKADRYLRDWEWTAEVAANLEDVIRHKAWDLLPRVLADLMPFVSEVQIKTMTRPISTWQGNYKRLLANPPEEMRW